ncbi:SymE family type I addiction module toxin [Pseudomonas protegens]|uniref:SymE family type I addiction module toxin n=1 Tax=Pseudomonas protegens TaxID=380021 RepID=UPI001F43EF6F|nr:SymE family type I addiction module toxin [Pseudomonas protegens]
MAKADHRAALPKTERFATIAADFYPPLGDVEYPQHRLVPWLRLRGHWLQQAGFEVNQKIRIAVSKNRLVITAE